MRFKDKRTQERKLKGMRTPSDSHRDLEKQVNPNNSRRKNKRARRKSA